MIDNQDIAKQFVVAELTVILWEGVKERTTERNCLIIAFPEQQ